MPSHDPASRNRPSPAALLAGAVLFVVAAVAGCGGSSGDVGVVTTTPSTPPPADPDGGLKAPTPIGASPDGPAR